MAKWPAFVPILIVGLAIVAYAQQTLLLEAFNSMIPTSLQRAFGLPYFLKAAHEPPSAQWDQLYHLGGNSPWVPKVDAVASTNLTVPHGCRVDQVHMVGEEACKMSRHAERYPTIRVGLRMLALHDRLQQVERTLNGSLAFAKDWEFFIPDMSASLENLVSTGPYAGTLEAFTTGVKLRTRYNDLLDEATQRGKVSFWASGSHRVEETARYFGAGFFGLDWQKQANLIVIPETEGLGADTLTPGDTCLDYSHNVNKQGHDHGVRMMSAFRSTYLPAIARRLTHQSPELELSNDEVYAMQEICGFETIVKGSSPWCEVFTHEEWESFEYARDLIHYYRAGPGNLYGAPMGWLWLNATANLLRDGSEAGELFFSFVHDGDIVPMLAALDLLPQTPHLPVTHVEHNRTWRTSDVTPMGGRIIFERLACPAEQHCWDNGPMYPNHRYCEPPREDVFVRIDINDGIVALPGCESGPGSSCPLEAFLDRVEKRGEEVGEFGKVCGLPADAAKSITFLHQ